MFNTIPFAAFAASSVGSYAANCSAVKSLPKAMANTSLFALKVVKNALNCAASSFTSPTRFSNSTLIFSYFAKSALSAAAIEAASFPSKRFFNMAYTRVNSRLSCFTSPPFPPMKLHP